MFGWRFGFGCCGLWFSCYGLRLVLGGSRCLGLVGLRWSGWRIRLWVVAIWLFGWGFVGLMVVCVKIWVWVLWVVVIGSAAGCYDWVLWLGQRWKKKFGSWLRRFTVLIVDCCCCLLLWLCWIGWIRIIIKNKIKIGLKTCEK